MTIQELKSLISALRAETQEDSISPDSLGAILDKVVNVIEAHISPLDKLETLADTAELPTNPTKSEQRNLYLIDGQLYALRQGRGQVILLPYVRCHTARSSHGHVHMRRRRHHHHAHQKRA